MNTNDVFALWSRAIIARAVKLQGARAREKHASTCLPRASVSARGYGPALTWSRGARAHNPAAPSKTRLGFLPPSPTLVPACMLLQSQRGVTLPLAEGVRED